MKSTVSRHLPSPRLLLATAATALVASLAFALSSPASISIDGQRVASDVAPVTTADGAYLPLRAVADASGAQTSFDLRSGAITVRRGVDVLVMHVGTAHALLNGRQVTLAHAPFTVRGRAMVAAATVTRTFGSSVRFDPRRNRVAVRTPGVVVAGAADDEP
jgi:hypothetical protein